MLRGELINVSESDHSSDGTPSNSCADDENDQIYDSMNISGMQSFESRPSVPSIYDQLVIKMIIQNPSKRCSLSPRLWH